MRVETNSIWPEDRKRLEEIIGDADRNLENVEIRLPENFSQGKKLDIRFENAIDKIIRAKINDELWVTLPGGLNYDRIFSSNMTGDGTVYIVGDFTNVKMDIKDSPNVKGYIKVKDGKYYLRPFDSMPVVLNYATFTPKYVVKGGENGSDPVRHSTYFSVDIFAFGKGGIRANFNTL